MPTHHEKLKQNILFAKLLCISQKFRIFAKYSERYCSRSVARAIGMRAGMLWIFSERVFKF